MRDASHSAAGQSTRRRALVVVGLLCVVGVACALAGTAAATPQSDGPNENGSASFEFDEEPVAHDGESLFVWRRESLDVAVSLGPAATGERVCLYRAGPGRTPTEVGCRRLPAVDAARTVTFQDAGPALDGPTAFRFAARVQDGDDRVLSRTRSRRVVRITNWSALDERRFDEHARASGLLEESENTSTPTPTDERPGGNVRQHFAGGESVGERIEVPTGVTGPFGVPLHPVTILGGCGLLALLCLLFVQRRRRAGRGSGPGDGIVVETGDPDRPPTDTERVARLLAEHGGRLKQSEIVEATDWSKAKVSRVLTKMTDRGYVEKHQRGRQNVIVLRRHE